MHSPKPPASKAYCLMITFGKSRSRSCSWKRSFSRRKRWPKSRKRRSTERETWVLSWNRRFTRCNTNLQLLLRNNDYYQVLQFYFRTSFFTSSSTVSSNYWTTFLGYLNIWSAASLRTLRHLYILSCSSMLLVGGCFTSSTCVDGGCCFRWSLVALSRYLLSSMDSTYSDCIISWAVDSTFSTVYGTFFFLVLILNSLLMRALIIAGSDGIWRLAVSASARASSSSASSLKLSCLLCSSSARDIYIAISI